MAGLARITALLVMAIFGAVVVGCSSAPYDDLVPFRIRNDGTSPLTVVQCGASCRQAHEVDRLRPGKSVPFNGGQGIPQDFLVKDEMGMVVGCLRENYLRAHKPEPVIPTSRAKPCTASQMRHPGWWDRHFN